MCVASCRTITANCPCAIGRVIVTKRTLSIIKRQFRISLRYVNFAVLCDGIVTDAMEMVPTIETTEIQETKFDQRETKSKLCKDMRNESVEISLYRLFTIGI